MAAMTLQDAYKKLGYKDLWPNPRTPDWSAENDNGVCISIWAKELNNKPCLDTRTDCGDSTIWSTRSANKKRIMHLSNAELKFGKLVDVVLLYGPVGTVEDARPWKGKKWKITYLDKIVGHFRVELEEGK